MLNSFVSVIELGMTEGYSQRAGTAIVVTATFRNEGQIEILWRYYKIASTCRAMFASQTLIACRSSVCPTTWITANMILLSSPPIIVTNGTQKMATNNGQYILNVHCCHKMYNLFISTLLNVENNIRLVMFGMSSIQRAFSSKGASTGWHTLTRRSTWNNSYTYRTIHEYLHYTIARPWNNSYTYRTIHEYLH